MCRLPEPGPAPPGQGYRRVDDEERSLKERQEREREALQQKQLQDEVCVLARQLQCLLNFEDFTQEGGIPII